MGVIGQALANLADPAILLAMAGAAGYGLLVGSIPGLTATMAVALIIPITFFMEPVPALAVVMALSAMAIFAGDLPGALLRIPGTPASAAYADEAYRMTQKGEAGLALGTGLLCSAMGGVFGAVVLIVAAPEVAKIALQFSSYEKFWLACLGLTAAVAVSHGDWAKGVLSLALGLAIAQVGLDPVSGLMRFTFGLSELSGGLGFIPVLIGLFALPELLRYAWGARACAGLVENRRFGGIFRGLGGVIGRNKAGIGRGAVLGTVIGAIPGAGLSPRRHAFGQGTPDGIASASAANNASIGGALIPATVFGIPGDSLTAIIIGVLYLKGLNPGPTVFILHADLITTVFMAFLVANIMIVPLGLAAIYLFRYVLAVPRWALMPSILAFCIIGAFAVENTSLAVGVMLGMGLVGYVLEENGFPLAPAILGLVIGPMLEENFLTSLTRARGDLLAFVERPVSAGLASVTLALWVLPLLFWLWRRWRNTMRPT